jgi:deoxyribose-phosphate aldolase
MEQPIQRYLDAAILFPETTREAAAAAIACDIELAQSLCKESETKVCVVLGFPHGQQRTASKADEARHYVGLGVDEIDMVANYGWVRSGLWDEVKADIAAVSAITKPAGIVLKVIFETAHLEADQIMKLTEVCIEANADFVKTSTGFNGEGAKDADVKLMLETAAGRIKVKPSGGIRDRARAEMLIGMGADRLGVNWSSCVAICSGEGASSAGGY